MKCRALVTNGSWIWKKGQLLKLLTAANTVNIEIRVSIMSGCGKYGNRLSFVWREFMWCHICLFSVSQNQPISSTMANVISNKLQWKCVVLFYYYCNCRMPKLHWTMSLWRRINHKPIYLTEYDKWLFKWTLLLESSSECV